MHEVLELCSMHIALVVFEARIEGLSEPSIEEKHNPQVVTEDSDGGRLFATTCGSICVARCLHDLCFRLRIVKPTRAAPSPIQPDCLN